MRHHPAIHSSGLVCLGAWVLLGWASHQPTHVDLWLFFGVMAVAWGATLTAARAATDEAPWRAILLWAVAFRVVGLFAFPVLEDDWYRYLWDGRMLVETGSPYGVAPLAFFGDPSVPTAFADLLDGVNHPDLPTVYGPVTQLVFGLAYLIAPGSLLALKLLLVTADLALVVGMRRLLPPGRWLFLAWCPLLVQETAFNAHPEILGIALAVGALLVRDRPLTSAALIGLAVGARMLALPLVPLVLRFDPRRWLAFAAALALAYLPFVAQGTDWSSLSLMATEWRFNTLGLALLTMVLPDPAARIVGAVLVLAVCAVLLRRDPGDGWPRGDVMFIAFLAFAPAVNPWYALWLLPFVAMYPSRWGVAALAVVSLSYAHGLFISGLPPYAHPWWVRPVEMAVVLGALVVPGKRR